MAGRTYVAFGYQTHRRTYRLKSHIILTGVAGLVFVGGLAASLHVLQVNHSAGQGSPSGSRTSSSGQQAPSTAKPSAQAIAGYTVAPGMPRYLDIPSLGVHSRIVALGTLSDGSLDAPDNIYDVGWYNKSALPGQNGAILLDGHVSSWTARGVFYGLDDLKPGDRLRIQRGDGRVFTYQVVKSRVFASDNVDMRSAMRPVTLGKPGLNLITCTGNVIKGTSQFNQRIIVYTEQV